MDHEVLSDVHAFNNFENLSGSKYSISRFEFIVKTSKEHKQIKRRHREPPDDTHSQSVCKKRNIYTLYNRETTPLVAEEDTQCLDKANEGNSDKRSGQTDTGVEADVTTEKMDEDGDFIVDEDGDLTTEEDGDLTVDEDGDFSGRRQPLDKAEESSTKDDPEVSPDKPVFDKGYINIKHHLATSLQHVGEQVWLGSLLLSDYIIDQHEGLTGQVVLDLGSGTGLTSIVAALYADCVYCTDTGENVLVLAQENVESARLYPSLPWPICPVHVRDLNWCTGLKEPEKRVSRIFDLRQEDIDAVQNATVIIAADVVYDDSITDAFFSTLWSLIDQVTDKVIYIGLEKRLVFTLDDLDVASPAYQHFRRGLDGLLVKGKTYGIDIHLQQITTEFPQYFKYTRTKQLELWKIWTERGVT